MREQTARIRAHRGAAWLDKRFGRKWRRLIARRRLDMSRGGFYPDLTGCGCILAQLDAHGLISEDGPLLGYGSYAEATRILGLSEQQEARLGFTISLPTDAVEDFPRLTEAWREELRQG